MLSPSLGGLVAGSDSSPRRVACFRLTVPLQSLEGDFPSSVFSLVSALSNPKCSEPPGGRVLCRQRPEGLAGRAWGSSVHPSSRLGPRRPLTL